MLRLGQVRGMHTPQHWVGFIRRLFNSNQRELLDLGGGICALLSAVLVFCFRHREMYRKFRPIMSALGFARCWHQKRSSFPTFLDVALSYLATLCLAACYKGQVVARPQLRSLMRRDMRLHHHHHHQPCQFPHPKPLQADEILMNIERRSTETFIGFSSLGLVEWRRPAGVTRNYSAFQKSWATSIFAMSLAHVDRY